MIDYVKRTPGRIDYTKRTPAPAAAELDAHQEMLAGMAQARRAYALTVARRELLALRGHSRRA